jgi:hypothetical protein
MGNGQLTINANAFSSGMALTIEGSSVFYSTSLPESNFLQHEYNMSVVGGLVTTDVGLASTGDWADYVFHDDYELRSLPELQKYLLANKHLPGFPSANEVQMKGSYSLDAHLKALLKQVEELTLYKIEMAGQLRRASINMHRLTKK